MWRTTKLRVRSAAGILIVASALSGCTDAPVAPTLTHGSSGRSAELSRAIAAALADSTVRVSVRDAMRVSPFARHRIVLQEFLRSEAGGPMLASVARSLGVRPEAVLASLASIGALEFYLPRRSDRTSWTGTSNIAVAIAVREGETPELAFTPRGSMIAVSALRRGGLAGSVPVALIGRPARSLIRRAAPTPWSPRNVIEDPDESTFAAQAVIHRSDGDSTVLLPADWARMSPGHRAATDVEPGCGDGTEIISCDYTTAGNGGGFGASTFLGTLWVLGSSDNGSMNDPLELRFHSYYTRFSDGGRIDHTVLSYDVANDALASVNGVLSPHVVSSGSGYYIHTEVWEDDGWWADDHYGDADITSSSMYSAQGSSAPFFHQGSSRCGYVNPYGYFACPPAGLYYWYELNWNIYHS